MIIDINKPAEPLRNQIFDVAQLVFFGDHGIRGCDSVKLKYEWDGTTFVDGLCFLGGCESVLTSDVRKAG